MKPKMDLKILPATLADMNLFFRFLTTYFFPEEPLARALGSVYKTVEELPLLNVLSEGFSFKAVNASDQSEDNMVGLILNATRIPDEDFEEELKNSSDPAGLSKILKLLQYLESQSDFWNRIQVDKAFDTIFVSVKPNCRGLNIGKKLIEKSLSHAKSLGFEYATVECSSIYSAKIAANLGYEVFYDLKYDEYRDENNEIIFKVEPPHKSIVMYVKKL